MRRLGFLLSAVVVTIFSLGSFPAATVAKSPRWALPGAPIFINHHNVWVECSVGFPLVDDDGNHYFLTARQCFFGNDYRVHFHESEKGDVVYSVLPDGGHGSPVGKAFLHLQSTPTNFYDVELVKLYPGASVGSTGFPSIKALDAEPHDAPLGDKVCMVGKNLVDSVCGKVSRLDADLIYRGADLASHVDVANYCGEKYGDSGGAVYDGTGAVGIHVGGFKDKDGCKSVFAPLLPVFTVIKRTIPSIRMATEDTA